MVDRARFAHDPAVGLFDVCGAPDGPDDERHRGELTPTRGPDLRDELPMGYVTALGALDDYPRGPSPSCEPARSQQGGHPPLGDPLGQVGQQLLTAAHLARIQRPLVWERRVAVDGPRGRQAVGLYVHARKWLRQYG